MAEGSGSEFELKLDLTEADFKRLKRGLRRTGGKSRPTKKRLRSIYFDTPDHALHDAGISLRLRDTGTCKLQTVKLDTGVTAGISNPVEVEFETLGTTPDIDAIPDKSVRKRIRQVVGKEYLKPIFETDIVRTAVTLKNGKAIAELALDKGEILSPVCREPITEVELELKGGDARAMLAMAKELLDGVPIRLGQTNKAGRGYRLASGEEEAGPTPVKGRLPRLEPGMDAVEAFRLVAVAAVDQILKNRDALFAGKDPEAVHQLRVGLRRLRAALQAFRPVLDPKRIARLDRKLRKAGRIASGLRDRDVLLGELVRPVLPRAGVGRGPPALERRLEKDLKRQRREVRRKLAGPGLNGLLLELSMLAGVPCGNGTMLPVERVADIAMQDSWRRVRRRARKIDTLDEEGRHALRKAMKGLRYTAEFFEALYPGEHTASFISSMRSLQDSFGYLNDVALARRLPEIVGRKKAGPSVRRTMSFVVGWHSALAEREWAETAALWKVLKRQPKYWHESA